MDKISVISFILALITMGGGTVYALDDNQLKALKYTGDKISSLSADQLLILILVGFGVALVIFVIQPLLRDYINRGKGMTNETFFRLQDATAKESLELLKRIDGKLDTLVKKKKVK